MPRTSTRAVPCFIAGLVALMLAAPTRAEPICETPIGWCTDKAGGVAADCVCEHDGEPVPGRPAEGLPGNPLTRLGAAVEEDFRSVPSLIAASRSFAGPGQYPPADFRAYGILLFKSKASRFDRDRHLMFCETYMNALAPVGELPVSPRQQMVTIWPVDRDETAAAVDVLPADEACAVAVDHYGLVQAQNALEILKRFQGQYAPYDTGGRGPFLVAWTPGSGITEPGTVALVVDLSDIDQPEEATATLGLWRDQIQDDPALWAQPPGADALIAKIRRFFDRNGALLEGLGAL